MARHKWTNGRGRHSVCTVCGCEKDRGVYSIRYTLKNGAVTQVSPECVGVVENFAHELPKEPQTEALNKHNVSGSLPDAEIFLWLQKQKYQTEQGEQEYKMYFDVDMPKIIKAAIAHFSSGNDR